MSHLRRCIQEASAGKRGQRNQPSRAKAKPSLRTKPRAIIVLKNDHAYRHCLKQFQALGLNPKKAVPGLRTVVFHYHSANNLKGLRAHSMVKRVEHDHRMKLHVGSRSPRQGGARLKETACASVSRRQIVPWGIKRIGAPKLWKRTTGRYLKVAVLDTGIDSAHPDLHVAGSFNTIDRSKVKDLNGHGTHVAGTIAALNNTFGVIGVAPRVRLYAVKAFNKNGTAYSSDIAQGLDWCIRNKMNVINMSFGMEQESPTIRELIRKAHRRGIVLVASAGNSGSSTGSIDFPARLPEVLAVAATTPDNQIASFSSRGQGIALAAPGQDICSTYPKRSYQRLDGTSMAAPHVTGASALLLSRNRRLTPIGVKRLLVKSAVPLPGYSSTDQGAGLLRLK